MSRVQRLEVWGREVGKPLDAGTRVYGEKAFSMGAWGGNTGGGVGARGGVGVNAHVSKYLRAYVTPETWNVKLGTLLRQAQDRELVERQLQAGW